MGTQVATQRDGSSRLKTKTRGHNLQYSMTPQKSVNTIVQGVIFFYDQEEMDKEASTTESLLF